LSQLSSFKVSIKSCDTEKPNINGTALCTLVATCLIPEKRNSFEISIYEDNPQLREGIKRTNNLLELKAQCNLEI